MKNIVKRLKSIFTFHRHEYKKEGSLFFAGYMRDGDVYLQKYKCKCGAETVERV